MTVIRRIAQGSQPAPTEPGRREARLSRLRVPSLHLIAATFLLATVVLVAGNLLRAPESIDHRIMNAVQGVDLPLLERAMQWVEDMTQLPVAVVIWAALLLAFGVAKRWLAALTFLAVPVLVGLSVGLGLLIPNLDRPDAGELHRSVGNAQLETFPSTSVVGAVLLFGLLYWIASGFQRQYFRLTVQVTSATVILMSGVSGIWLGTYWPSEVLSGYALGGLMLVGLIWAYQRIKRACGDIPFIHAAYVPHDESVPHAHALTSTIIFNEDTVSKIYAPGFVPRAIYWLAFQAEFPYIRNQAALRAAVLRRNLAGLLTEYWYGENRVARAIGIDTIDGHFAITSERVQGGPPRDNHDVRAFLFNLADRFDAAGLPTWQVDPRQPRAKDNVIETPDGRYHIIDLESGLVSPLASPRAWLRALRRGLFPLYDDVFFDITRAYVREEEVTIRAQMGEEWTGNLLASVDRAEEETRGWHDSEPRVWSRLLGGRRRQQSDTEDRGNRAQRWFDESITAWEGDHRITGAEAEQLREAVAEPQFVAVLPHFGVHLAIGVVLRFPFGSIARASYTLINLILGTLRFLLRGIDRKKWSQLVGVHSPIVVLFAGLPGVGTFAYLASKPIRSNHLLLRVGIDAVGLKFPWNVYERTGLRWVIARPIMKPSAVDVRRAPLRLPVWPQSVVLIMGLAAGALFAADIVAQFADRILAPDVAGWEQIMRILDLGAEASLGTWYSVVGLAFLSLALGIVAFAKHAVGDRYARHWLVLAILSLGFSLDEQAKFHDPGGNTAELREQIGLQGPIYYGWVILGLASVLLVTYFYRRFVADLPKTTRRLFMLAAALYVGGEIFLESMSGWYADVAGTEGDLVYQMITSFEEFFGMLGMFVGLAAVLHYIQTEYGEVRVILSDYALANGLNSLPADAQPAVEEPPLKLAGMNQPGTHGAGRPAAEPSNRGNGLDKAMDAQRF